MLMGRVVKPPDQPLGEALGHMRGISTVPAPRTHREGSMPLPPTPFHGISTVVPELGDTQGGESGGKVQDKTRAGPCARDRCNEGSVVPSGARASWAGPETQEPRGLLS